MLARCIVVCFALLAVAAATQVKQCPGLSFASLQDDVELTKCDKPPCKLKKGKSQHISIAFTPEKDTEKIKNYVNAQVFGVPLPFVGVDGESICDKVFLVNGDKASCPLTGGTKYVYKDSFPILSIYPVIDTKVHWAIRDSKDHDLICFEVPAKIVN